MSGGGCCGNGATPAPVTHEDVKEYYGKTLKKSEDLLTSACTISWDESGHVRPLLANVHETILSKFYGCGSPIPPLLVGATVVDLGCGTGRDVYVAAQLVGEQGKVIGVDMTDEQLDTAREFEEWQREKFGYSRSNVVFKKALLEDLKTADLEDKSVDVVISNCVINLVMDKGAVLGEVARVLKSGGELYFSDIFADRRVPKELQQDKVLYGECLTGALYMEDFRRLMAKAGLGAWGVVSEAPVALADAIKERLAPIRFFSVTVRAVKLPGCKMEDMPEDFGQLATYNGSILGHEREFLLDSARRFPSGVPVRVDGTTANMLLTSRYSQAFAVTARGSHAGPFRQWPASLASVPLGWQPQEADANGAQKQAASSCCPPKPAADNVAQKQAASSCCPPKPVAAAVAADVAQKQEASSCCAPKQEASSCCAPKQEASSCCAPKQEASSCCAPSAKKACC